MAQYDRPRGQASKSACTVCHRRKVRCDAQDVGIPCTNCTKTGARQHQCQIHEKARGSRRRKVSLQDATPSTPSVPVADEPQQQQQPSSSPSSCGLGLSSLHPSDQYKRHLVEFVDQPLADTRPIDKNARVIYIGAQVSNVHHLASQHFGQKTCHVSHYPTDRLDRRQTCHEPDRLPVEALELPPRATVDRLLEAYFAHANPGFPVVDEDLFWEQYRARDPGNPPSLLLLHAMLVVGAHVLYAPGPGVDSQEEQGLRASAKATFFRRAKALFDARFERNRDTLVQAALLLTWHTDGPEDVAANAWFWVGVALRTATGLGMHRDAEGSTVVAHNRRMWRRVWWLLVRCDVALALQYGRPRCVRLDECDVRPVEPADFAHCGPATEVAYVTHSIELAVLASRMLDCRFPLASAPSSSYFPSYCTPAPQASPDAVIRELNHALARWSLDLPDELGPRPGRSLGLWPAYLQLQYNTLLILVHRAPPWQQQRSSHDANVCAVAAGCIVSLLQTIRDAGGLRSLWLSAANSIFTALIQMDAQVRESSPALAVPALTQYDAAVALLREFADLWPNSLPILHFFEHLRTPGRRVGTPADAVARGEAGEAVGGEEDADDLPRKNSEDGLEPVFEEGPHDISEAWNEWRSAHWQDIDMDEMPFIF